LGIDCTTLGSWIAPSSLVALSKMHHVMKTLELAAVPINEDRIYHLYTFNLTSSHLDFFIYRLSNSPKTHSNNPSTVTANMSDIDRKNMSPSMAYQLIE